MRKLDDKKKKIKEKKQEEIAGHRMQKSKGAERSKYNEERRFIIWIKKTSKESCINLWLKPTV
jgi:hypothetical protein